MVPTILLESWAHGESTGELTLTDSWGLTIFLLAGMKEKEPTVGGPGLVKG